LEMLQRCIREGSEFNMQGHTLTYGSYAYKYISKVKHNLRLLSKLGTTYVSSHHPTTQPPAPNQYYLWCLVDPPFDIKSHKIQTNKEPRDEESASCMQWDIRKGVFPCSCSKKTNADLEMRMLWNECMPVWCSLLIMKKYSTDLGICQWKLPKAG